MWTGWEYVGRIAGKEKEEYTVRTKTWQNRTNILYLTTEILYPKTENVNAQMKLKPLWFGLFLILIETWEQ